MIRNHPKSQDFHTPRVTPTLPTLGGPLWAVHLSTTDGPVYIATDDTDTADLDAPVLTRAEIDALLDVVSRTAAPGYLRRTLWLELHALVALKRSLLTAGPGTATFLEPGELRGQTVDLAPTATPDVPAITPAEPEQLGLL